ncbi:hypothetical protein P5673_030340 [Acropora cervicornis]|uniref:Uncharacterized protein n=1 Tax=Acropora cervicornis TaxID=6130 RepID=A0AAD9PUC9_ACRCE|nr:hypothetical protein P5673_030340 [Acropora cervicornis]
MWEEMTEDEYMEAGESFDISPLRSKPLSSDQDDEDEEDMLRAEAVILRQLNKEHRPSRDDWKINFRELHEDTYFMLWTSLLISRKVNEALLAAEQGRAQTLSDNLLMQYKLPAPLSAATINTKETISRLFTELSTTTIFLAIADLAINIWFLSRKKQVVFRRGMLEGDRTEEDPTRALLTSSLEKIGTEDTHIDLSFLKMFSFNLRSEVQYYVDVQQPKLQLNNGNPSSSSSCKASLSESRNDSRIAADVSSVIA